MTLQEIKAASIGITKREIAARLDAKSHLFNYNVETGATSYNNYTRDELLRHCIQFDVNPISGYHNKRSSCPVS